MFTLLLKALNTKNVVAQTDSDLNEEARYQFNENIDKPSKIKSSFSEYSTRHWFSKEAFSHSLAQNYSKE